MRSLLIAFGLLLFLRTFILQTFVIISGSMEETLLNGDLLLVNRAAVGSRIPFTTARIPGYSTPKRGDVLVFDPHHEDDMKLVKRLLGLPGDTVQMKEKQLYINGEALSEPYLKHVGYPYGEPAADMSWQSEYLVPGVDPATYRPTPDDWGPIAVPQGHYFMLGDNRDQSLDSRYWGPLEASRVEGRVMLIYFSYERESYRPFPWLRQIRWGRIGDRPR